MSVVDKIQPGTTAFSFEILPPLRGKGMNSIVNTIEMLREFDPKYINITIHRSEVKGDKHVSLRQRPGTVAVAAAIKHHYGIDVVPHIVCGGFTREETEDALIDLQFLGITDLLLLRGDKAKTESHYVPTAGGNNRSVDLQKQVNDFNEGLLEDGTRMDAQLPAFSYGMACYPEMHEESSSIDEDVRWAKMKVDGGASYLVTQMFFDNEKYFSFVKRCREVGIKVPIIPGIKPITRKKQMDILPQVFHLNMPEALRRELNKCATDEDASEVGVEWCTQQTLELKRSGVPSIHFYALNAAESIRRIAKNIY